MRYFEDFTPGQIVELGTTTVSADEIVEFASQFDPQYFHVHPERAQSSIYGGLIASGWHSGSLFMRLMADGVLLDTDTMGSPGVEALRWPRPVRPGDVLRGRWEVLECRVSRSKPDRGLVRSRGELFNQDGALVFSMEAVNFFGRRPGAPESEPGG